VSSAVRRRREQKPGSLVANELIVEGMSSFLERHFNGGAAEMLDLGAGTKPYAPLYEPYFRACTALDVDHSPHGTGSVDVVASADHMPFGDARFDCVIATEVLEHCRDPLAVLRETARVLAPGGKVLVTTPFLLGLHEEPHDYYRYTPYALQDLAERAGLQVESIQPRGDLLAVLLSVLLFFVVKPLSALGSWFYRYRNPVVWLLVVAPQLAYLRYWRATRDRAEPGGLSAAMRRSPTGYITVLSLPSAAAPAPRSAAP
jgi:SAM-dependent methyltransferase